MPTYKQPITNGFEAFTIVVLDILMLIFLALWQAWIVSIIYGWTMLPFGLPALGMAAFIGLASIIAIFRRVPEDSTEFGSPWQRFAVQWGKGFFKPLAILAFTWVFLLFV